MIGVEPNREMREAGDRVLRGFTAFRSVDGTAEGATLANRSVDVVAAGQAFHWFDVRKAREEFGRILRPGGRVVVVWNDRNLSASPLMADYEELLHEFGTDYERVDHQRHGDALVREFFASVRFEHRTLAHEQVLDREGLRGRLMSSSYVPGPGRPRHREMLLELDALFDTHQRCGTVAFSYTTRVYFAPLSGSRASTR